MKAAFLLALPCLGALVGCTTQWPTDMPARTYSGIVVLAPNNRPESAAEITAVRPSCDLSFYPPALLIPYSCRNQKIGETRSQANGHFVLTTTGGYATQLITVSRDGWMEGLLDSGLRHNRSGIAVTLHAAQREISYHSVSLNSDESSLLSSAFGKIVEQYVATHRRSALSVAAYRVQGIFSPDEYALLVRLKAHLLGEHPDIEMVFSRCIVRIDSFTRPVRFEPHRDPFTGPAGLLDTSS